MCFSVISQNNCKSANRKIKKIEKYIIQGNNNQAFDLLNEMQLMCDRSDFFVVLGDIYYQLKNIEKARECYFKSYQISQLVHVRNQSLNRFLKSLYYTGNYEIFNQVVNDPKFVVPSDLKVLDLMRKNQFSFELKKDSVDFHPVFLNVNSKADEYFPSMPINSDVIIYTYRDPSSTLKDEDFFISRKEHDYWLKPIALGDNINSEYRDGSLSVSLDGKNLFFASCHRPDSYGGCDLYYSRLINDTVWLLADNIGAVVNTKYWESQPSISADGKILFFVSNRYGGYGGTDIWMSKKYNNSWSEPINLGPEINTSSDEYTPFLHYDNKTFYFASKGHEGFGGFDLYVAELTSDDKFHSIQNLGYPINTHHDESGLIVTKDGLNGYFNSNGLGNLDIYSFTLPSKFSPDPVAIIQGQLIDSISRMGVPGNISIFDVHKEWKHNLNVDHSGFFSFSVPLQSFFEINVYAENYDFISKKISLKKDEYLRQVNIVLDRLRLGDKINLENIYYEFDDYSLKKESLMEIKKIAKYLILNNKLELEIGGHTDDVGSASYNMELSKKRAKSVYEALILNGVNSRQLTYRGYGNAMPLVIGDNELARIKNRRTELKITGKK